MENKNTDVKKGDKVRFAYPDKGFAYDRTHAKMHLDPDKTYTVAKVKHHSVDSDVYLEEVPGIAFNLALFCKAN